MDLIATYTVLRASGPITIDGRLQEADWERAGRFDLQKALQEPGDIQPLRARTRVAALWDAENLYLAFEIEDKEIWATLTSHDDRLFHEECVEFFLDPGGDGRWYIEAQINSLNTVRDLLVDGSVAAPGKTEYDAMARWHFKNMRTAVEIRSGWGWTLEAAIPWREFGFSGRSFHPQPGEELRINCCRYERSQSCPEIVELSSWSKVERSFHEPQRFGRFVFASSRDC